MRVSNRLGVCQIGFIRCRQVASQRLLVTTELGCAPFESLNDKIDYDGRVGVATSLPYGERGEALSPGYLG